MPPPGARPSCCRCCSRLLRSPRRLGAPPASSRWRQEPAAPQHHPRRQPPGRQAAGRQQASAASAPWQAWGWLSAHLIGTHGCCPAAGGAQLKEGGPGEGARLCRRAASGRSAAPLRRHPACSGKGRCPLIGEHLGRVGNFTTRGWPAGPTATRPAVLTVASRSLDLVSATSPLPHTHTHAHLFTMGPGVRGA